MHLIEYFAGLSDTSKLRQSNRSLQRTLSDIYISFYDNITTAYCKTTGEHTQQNRLLLESSFQKGHWSVVLTSMPHFTLSVPKVVIKSNFAVLGGSNEPHSIVYVKYLHFSE